MRACTRQPQQVVAPNRELIKTNGWLFNAATPAIDLVSGRAHSVTSVSATPFITSVHGRAFQASSNGTSGYGVSSTTAAADSNGFTAVVQCFGNAWGPSGVIEIGVGGTTGFVCGIGNGYYPSLDSPCYPRATFYGVAAYGPGDAGPIPQQQVCTVVFAGKTGRIVAWVNGVKLLDVAAGTYLPCTAGTSIKLGAWDNALFFTMAASLGEYKDDALQQNLSLNPWQLFQERTPLYTGMGSGSWTPIEVTG